jgi:hypothetical protein
MPWKRPSRKPVTPSVSDKFQIPPGYPVGFLRPVTGVVTRKIKNFIWEIAQKFKNEPEITRSVDIITLTTGYKIVILA